MRAKTIACLMFALLNLTTCAFAQNVPDNDFWTQDSLTNGFFGLNDALDPHGIELGFSLTQVFQQNAKGGLATHPDAGAFPGSYNLELFADLETLAGLSGATAYLLTEGSWPHAQGLNEAAGGALQNIDDDAAGHRALDVTEFWFQQSFADDHIRLRLGKVDLTAGFEHHNCPVSFDCSHYANDETLQFLNSALVNNPSIPFPDNGLGAMLYVSPYDLWYFALGAADAHADARETGFSTTFHGPDDFLYLFETGITPSLPGYPKPLAGAWRIGLWYDPQPLERFDSIHPARDTTGFYATLDQVLLPENADPEDTQGLAAFARYGYAPADTSLITQFFSCGCQYQGLLPHRDDDVLAIGLAQSILSDQAPSPADPDHDAETVCECYYNAFLSPAISLTPSVQYVANPAEDPHAHDALVFATRLQLTF